MKGTSSFLKRVPQCLGYLIRQQKWGKMKRKFVLDVKKKKNIYTNIQRKRSEKDVSHKVNYYYIITALKIEFGKDGISSHFSSIILQ